MARVSGQAFNKSTKLGGGFPGTGRLQDERDGMTGNVRHAQSGSSPYSSHADDGHVVALADTRAQKLVAQRLKEARIRAGYRSPKDFADASAINPTTYYHHENGRRAIRADVAKKYAELLRLPAGVLLYGEGLQTSTTVPIVGRITGDGRITMTSDSLTQQHVTFPAAPDLTGYIVIGEDLYPAYRDGDVVFHRKMVTVSKPSQLGQMHGLECVVELHDGTLLLRQVAIQQDGLATLFSYHSPPLFNQRIAALAPVEFVRRALPGHLGASRASNDTQSSAA